MKDREIVTVRPIGAGDFYLAKRTTKTQEGSVWRGEVGSSLDSLPTVLLEEIGWGKEVEIRFSYKMTVGECLQIINRFEEARNGIASDRL